MMYNCALFGIIWYQVDMNNLKSPQMEFIHRLADENAIEAVDFIDNNILREIFQRRFQRK